jgi:transglutaminase-like putative cysteine protease
MTVAGPEINTTVERLTAGVTDDQTKLRLIYEWVQEQVRYMAVEIGIGGYQLHAAEEACTRLYGDCKDMTTLICAMAREAGIDTRPALVSTWRNGRLIAGEYDGLSLRSGRLDPAATLDDEGAAGRLVADDERARRNREQIG